MQGWNITFKRPLSDCELPKATEFFNTVEQCKGLQEVEDTLSWHEHICGIFTVSSGYKDMNQDVAKSTYGHGNIFGESIYHTKLHALLD